MNIRLNWKFSSNIFYRYMPNIIAYYIVQFFCSRFNVLLHWKFEISLALTKTLHILKLELMCYENRLITTHFTWRYYYSK